MMKRLMLAMPFLFLVSCDVRTERKADPVEVGENKGDAAEAAYDVKKAETLSGQKLEVVQPALEAAGIMFRVVERDGQMFPVNMDYQPDRLNFRIKDGVIVEVTKG